MARMKVFTALSAALLLFMAVVGCSGGGSSDSGGDSGGATDKKFKITMFNPGFTASAAHPEKSQDPIGQMIDEKMNVDLNVMVVPDSPNDKLNVLIASGDPPDLIQTTRKTGIQLMEQGAIISLDSYLKKVPDLAKLYNDARWNPMKYKNQTIGIPAWENVGGVNGWWIRKDWLQALNLAVPTTTDELFQVMKAFTLSDPDHNGKNDTYGILGGLSKDGSLMFGLDNLLLAFGVYPGKVHLDNGKLALDDTDPRMKEGLAFLNKIVTENMIDPDWVNTDTIQKVNEKMYKGNVGIIRNDWRRMEPSDQQKMKEIGGSVPDWTVIPPVKGPRGDQYLEVAPFDDSMWVISKKAASEPGKVDRIMSMLQWFYTDKTEYNYLAYGVKGVTWDEKDGKPFVTDKFNTKDYYWMDHYKFVRKANDPIYFATKNPLTNGYHDLNMKYLKPDSLSPYLAPDPADTLLADRQKYRLEMTVKFITGKEPLSKWDEYVTTLKSKFGADTYLDISTKQLKEAGLMK